MINKEIYLIRMSYSDLLKVDILKYCIIDENKKTLKIIDERYINIEEPKIISRDKIDKIEYFKNISPLSQNISFILCVYTHKDDINKTINAMKEYIKTFFENKIIQMKKVLSSIQST